MNSSRIRFVGSIALVATASHCGGSAQFAGPSSVSYAETTSGGSTPAPSPVSSPYRVSGPTSTPSRTISAPDAPPSPPMTVAAGESAPSSAGAIMSVPVTNATTVVTVAVTTPIQQQAVREQEMLQPLAGLLTAATVGDSDRRPNYLEYLSRHPDEQEVLRLDLSRRVRFRVVDAQNRPVNDARITVSGEGARVSAKTHADGGWDFYPSISAGQLAGNVMVHVDSGQFASQQIVQIPASGDGQDVVFQLPVASATAPRVLDLGFMIDATGSMGDELRYVNGEIANIVQTIAAGSPGIQIRVGATFYRDRVDAQQLQMIPFTSNVSGFSAVMQGVVASGGGDYPEDMNQGFQAAMSRMAWSDGNAERVLVIIADAPPQMYSDERYTYQSAMSDAVQRGIRIVPVAASGADRTVEYLFRGLAALTSVPYVYLTDDSGVGAPHMEADTDRVAVEHFNDLLTRLVLSDLRGQGMHEPGTLGPRG